MTDLKDGQIHDYNTACTDFREVWISYTGSRHSALMHSTHLPALCSRLSTSFEPLYPHIPQSDLSDVSSDNS
jgi:hypothetical protein